MWQSFYLIIIVFVGPPFDVLSLKVWFPYRSSQHSVQQLRVYPRPIPHPSSATSCPQEEVPGSEADITVTLLPTKSFPCSLMSVLIWHMQYATYCAPADDSVMQTAEPGCRSVSSRDQTTTSFLHQEFLEFLQPGVEARTLRLRFATRAWVKLKGHRNGDFLKCSGGGWGRQLILISQCEPGLWCWSNDWSWSSSIKDALVEWMKTGCVVPVFHGRESGTRVQVILSWGYTIVTM